MDALIEVLGDKELLGEIDAETLAEGETDADTDAEGLRDAEGDTTLVAVSPAHSSPY